MIYAIVFLGSLLGIVLIVGLRILLRQRTIRRFVRSVRTRFESAEQRGAVLVDETVIDKPRKNPRTSAIELQQVRSLLHSADKAWKQGRFEEVERLLIQALTVHPMDESVSAELAKLYLTTNRESKAEAMYRELLQRSNDVSFHANLGLAYYRQGKYMEACYAYQDALNLDPKNPERSAALGRACIAAQRFEEAAPLLEKASAFLSRDIELLHLLAECYLQLNMRDNAEETYRRINKLEPYNEDVKAKMRSIAEAATDTGAVPA
ncbi:tetratricopeptide repeat protein [Candidatus Peribacteria bacterium]|nr:MAG: tetratricopeptide repeat protein [Candidatus Peribacteria bacterium]